MKLNGLINISSPEDPNKVTWNWVPGFEGRYMVSDSGTLMKVIEGKKKLSRNKQNYKILVSLKNADGTYIEKRKSHLILESFVGPCPEGLIACHYNDIGYDDRVSNLRWDTHKSNAVDRVRNYREKNTPESLINKFPLVKKLLEEGSSIRNVGLQMKGIIGHRKISVITRHINPMCRCTHRFNSHNKNCSDCSCSRFRSKLHKNKK